MFKCVDCKKKFMINETDVYYCDQNHRFCKNCFSSYSKDEMFWDSEEGNLEFTNQWTDNELLRAEEPLELGNFKIHNALCRKCYKIKENEKKRKLRMMISERFKALTTKKNPN